VTNHSAGQPGAGHPRAGQPSARPLSEVAVYLSEVPGDPVYVGILGTSYEGGRNLAASWFQYDHTYLTRPDRYELSPDLPLVATRTRTDANSNLFGAFADASPDDWGKKLVVADNARQRKLGAALPGRLGDFDFLIGVADNTRMGALRLATVGSVPSEPGHAWLGPDSPLATEVENLERTLRAAQRYEEHEATDDDIELLARTGTSPGGARPKVNFRRMGARLSLAKLPHSKDGNLDAEAWEAVALTIARNAGITTPRFSVERVFEDKSVLVVDRFDRRNVFEGMQNLNRRRGYMSAHTALRIGKNDDNSRITYEEFADTIAETSSAASEDLQEMYARIALTVLVNNVDDHWRNHGFIRQESGTGPGVGWRLSPVFDVNPSVTHGVIHSRAINDADDPQDRDIRNLHVIADAYGLTSAQGAAIISRVARHVHEWPAIARDIGIPENQFEQMSAAFDESQLAVAETLPHGTKRASRQAGSPAGPASESASDRRKKFPELFDGPDEHQTPASPGRGPDLEL
jgi:serine/threonine-protein kinase HipA